MDELENKSHAWLVAELETLATDTTSETQAERLQHKRRRIEAALTRITTGQFGVCQSCRQQIERQRLEALPYVELCWHCRRQQEEEKPHE